VYKWYLRQVSLQLIAGVHLIPDLVSERVVTFVPVIEREVGGLL